MTFTQTITIPENIAFSDEFLELKRKKQISNTIAKLLSSHFNIKKQAVPEDIASIENDLQELAARKALLLAKKEDYEKKNKPLTMKEEQERMKRIYEERMFRGGNSE